MAAGCQGPAASVGATPRPLLLALSLGTLRTHPSGDLLPTPAVVLLDRGKGTEAVGTPACATLWRTSRPWGGGGGLLWDPALGNRRTPNPGLHPALGDSACVGKQDNFVKF